MLLDQHHNKQTLEYRYKIIDKLIDYFIQDPNDKNKINDFLINKYVKHLEKATESSSVLGLQQLISDQLTLHYASTNDRIYIDKLFTICNIDDLESIRSGIEVFKVSPDEQKLYSIRGALNECLYRIAEYNTILFVYAFLNSQFEDFIDCSSSIKSLEDQRHKQFADLLLLANLHGQRDIVNDIVAHVASKLILQNHDEFDRRSFGSILESPEKIIPPDDQRMFKIDVLTSITKL